ncbi:unnamed protein product [Darwinula stevensoni]|uniref:UHRF1-binding protein 1-like n=1 Tax=Darwinula stevensoni TaxID=69355 RepID=A0A7R8X3J3_9CRUS|nr:unnamed protein product [Darwinula stevensoni]CAG0878700.1 unnamed protein product [Darwinula stevensoni]
MNVTRAKCNRVAAKIPWAHLKKMPIQLFLDEVEIELETSADLRTLSRTFIPSYSSGGSYGFADRVLDGASVRINNVNLCLRSNAFLATIQLTRVDLESRMPTWQKNDLRWTRIKDVTRGEILIFKELQWQTMKIEARSNQNLNLAPLRLITSQARARITLKKKLSDCSVLGCRLVLLMDDLLYVLTDSQLKAVQHFLDSLSHLVTKAQEQAKEIKAIRKLESSSAMMLPQATKRTSRGSCAFTRFDVIETSYHLYSDRLDLHFCDDPGEGRSSHPDLKEGGALQICLTKLQLDYYPYHLSGVDRKHWVRYSSSHPNQWQESELISFRNQLTDLIVGNRKHAPLARTAPVTDKDQGTLDKERLQPGMERGSGKGPPPPVALLRRLMASCLVLRITEFSVFKVTTTHRKSVKEFLQGNKENAQLPEQNHRIHIEFLQYYYPGNLDYPLPPSKLYMHVNPVQLNLDPLTLSWLNAFLLNLQSAIPPHAKTESEALDVRIEAILPQVIYEEEEHPGQPDRPKTLHLGTSRLLISNYRAAEVGPRSDLVKCLNSLQRGEMFFGSSFPSTPSDSVVVHPKFFKHAQCEDNIREVPLGDNEQGVPLDSLHRNSLWTDAKDVWYIHLDPCWADFGGSRATNQKPIAFIDAFPLELWIYQEEQKSHLHVLGHIASLVTCQLNHYQYLFLMRMLDDMTALQGVLLADSLRIQKQSESTRFSLAVLLPQVDVSLLMPVTSHEKNASVTDDSVIPETSSMTDLDTCTNAETNFRHQDTLEGLAKLPQENGPLVSLLLEQDSQTSRCNSLDSSQATLTPNDSRSSPNTSQKSTADRRSSFLADRNLALQENIRKSFTNLRGALDTAFKHDNAAEELCKTDDDAASTISSDSDSFILLGMDVENRSAETENLLDIPEKPRTGKVVVDVEVASEVLEDSGSEDPPISPFFKRKEEASEVISCSSKCLQTICLMVSIVTFCMGRVQLALQSQGGTSVMKVQLGSLLLEEASSMPWDEFQEKFRLRGHAWSEMRFDPLTSCEVKMRLTISPELRPPCLPFDHAILSISPDAYHLLRHRLSVQASHAQLRSIMEDLYQHGGILAELKIKDLHLHIPMNAVVELNALIEEEEIRPPVPLKGLSVPPDAEKLSAIAIALPIEYSACLWVYVSLSRAPNVFPAVATVGSILEIVIAREMQEEFG